MAGEEKRPVVSSALVLRPLSPWPVPPTMLQNRDIQPRGVKETGREQRQSQEATGGGGRPRSQAGAPAAPARGSPLLFAAAGPDEQRCRLRTRSFSGRPPPPLLTGSAGPGRAGPRRRGPAGSLPPSFSHPVAFCWDSTRNSAVATGPDVSLEVGCVSL